MPTLTSSSALRRRTFVAVSLALGLLGSLASGQTLPSPSSPYQLTVSPVPTPPPATTAPKPAAAPAPASASAQSASQSAVAQLTQSNRDLLELLKKQQVVLEDIQFDRRLTARQVQLLQDHLESVLQEKSELQYKNDKLQAALAAASAPPSAPSTNSAQNSPPAVAAVPPPPSTYLPPPQPDGAPGTKWWHRLFTLKGTDPQSTNLFHVQGPQWRVVWHNLDKPGDTYKNTSALFINAYPKDDTIPQKVCAKLGSGGDATELQGPGNYFLKIEASGGSWELAVEDFK
jgi:regulator of replication initiation timing